MKYLLATLIVCLFIPSSASALSCAFPTPQQKLVEQFESDLVGNNYYLQVVDGVANDGILVSPKVATRFKLPDSAEWGQWTCASKPLYPLTQSVSASDYEELSKLTSDYPDGIYHIKILGDLENTKLVRLSDLESEIQMNISTSKGLYESAKLSDSNQTFEAQLESLKQNKQRQSKEIKREAITETVAAEVFAYIFSIYFVFLLLSAVIVNIVHKKLKPRRGWRSVFLIVIISVVVAFWFSILLPEMARVLQILWVPVILFWIYKVVRIAIGKL